MEHLHQIFETPIKKSGLVERKKSIESSKTIVIAPAGVGATTLLFHALEKHKSSEYIYIDLNDTRVEKELVIRDLDAFCEQNRLTTLAIDGYDNSFVLPPMEHIYLSCTTPLTLEGFETISLLPLDFEEFLALDSRYDSLETALSHFLQIGGFPEMIHVATANRARHLQTLLKLYLSDLEYEIITHIAKHLGQKVSMYQIYERLKANRKLSKDHFYKTFYELIEKRWLFWLEKYAHPKATKKLYLIDFAIKNALTFSKNFSKLFESLIFLELIKVGKRLYYDEAIDFYIPDEDRVVLTLPFGTQSHLFSLMEKIEGWVIAHGVTKVEVVSMNSEATLHHPFVEVEMIAFTRWALIES